MLAVMMHQRLEARLGGWNSMVAVAGAYIALVVVAFAVMPELNEVPDDFPAVVLWKIRIASLGIQLAMWITLAFIFGALAEVFVLGPATRPRRAVR